MFSIRLADLAKKVHAKLYGDGDIIITGVASIQSAQSGHITFLTKNQYRYQLPNTQASAVVLKEADLKLCQTASLVVHNPYLAYAIIAQLWDQKSKTTKSIATTAIIHSTVKIGYNVSVGENTVIESEVELGNNISIGSGCFIGYQTKIGDNSCLSANVTIHHKIQIGKNCCIHSGTVIGSDGFGYANDNGTWIKIPQLGRVMIGDSVHIGSCTSIDRGALDDTIIGNNVIIDNQCQIAHNITIGNNTAIAGGVIMGGSLRIGNNCMIGGATVINGHIQICNQVTLTGMSMVIRSINHPGIYSSGIPVQSNTIWRKTTVLLMNIDKFLKRLKLLKFKGKKEH